MAQRFDPPKDNFSNIDLSKQEVTNDFIENIFYVNKDEVNNTSTDILIDCCKKYMSDALIEIRAQSTKSQYYIVDSENTPEKTLEELVKIIDQSIVKYITLDLSLSSQMQKSAFDAVKKLIAYKMLKELSVRPSEKNNQTQALMLLKMQFEQAQTRVNAPIYYAIGNANLTQADSSSNSSKSNLASAVKNNATKDLEKIVRAFLNEKMDVMCRYNHLDELEVIINGQFPPLNLTRILQNKPQYDLLFKHDNQANTDKDKNAISHQYVEFLQSKAIIKPSVKIMTQNGEEQVFPTEKLYKDRDQDKIHEASTYGEKLGMSLFSSELYPGVNTLLRSHGKKNAFNNSQFTDISNPHCKEFLNEGKLTEKTKECLLCAVFSNMESAAVSNAAKLKEVKGNEEYIAINRGESGKSIEALNAERKKSAAQVKNDQTADPIITVYNAQVSTTMNKQLAQNFANKLNTAVENDTTITIIGKKSSFVDIGPLSQFMKESELILPAGTQFRTIEYEEKGNKTYITAVVVNTTKGVPQCQYELNIEKNRALLISLQAPLKQLIKLCTQNDNIFILQSMDNLIDQQIKEIDDGKYNQKDFQSVIEIFKQHKKDNIFQGDAQFDSNSQEEKLIKEINDVIDNKSNSIIQLSNERINENNRVQLKTIIDLLSNLQYLKHYLEINDDLSLTYHLKTITKIQNILNQVISDKITLHEGKQKINLLIDKVLVKSENSLFFSISAKTSNFYKNLKNIASKELMNDEIFIKKLRSLFNDSSTLLANATMTPTTQIQTTTVPITTTTTTTTTITATTMPTATNVVSSTSNIATTLGNALVSPQSSSNNTQQMTPAVRTTPPPRPTQALPLSSRPPAAPPPRPAAPPRPSQPLPSGNTNTPARAVNSTPYSESDDANQTEDKQPKQKF